MDATKPHLSFNEMFALSAVAAGVSKSSMAPLERSSLLMSVAEGNTSQRFRFPPWFVVRRVIEEQGLASFWRGNVTNVLRYAGVAALACVFSLDTVRTLVAEDRGNALRRQELKKISRFFLTASKKVLRSDGVARLYRGFLICSCGVAVYRGVYFGPYLTLSTTVACQQLRGSLRSRMGSCSCCNACLVPDGYGAAANTVCWSQCLELRSTNGAKRRPANIYERGEHNYPPGARG
jgi:hypothetical protein